MDILKTACFSRSLLVGVYHWELGIQLSHSVKNTKNTVFRTTDKQSVMRIVQFYTNNNYCLSTEARFLVFIKHEVLAVGTHFG